MSRQIGQFGEQLAKTFLEEKGYYFIEANFRTRFGEIDLIMKEKEEVVFIEVKTRQEGNAISGTADLPPQKIERLQSAALSWVEEHEDEEWRMELVEVIILPTGLAKIRISPI